MSDYNEANEDDDALFDEEAQDFHNFDPARYVRRRSSSYADRSSLDDDVQDASGDFAPLEPGRRSYGGSRQRNEPLEDRPIQSGILESNLGAAGLFGAGSQRGGCIGLLGNIARLQMLLQMLGQLGPIGRVITWGLGCLLLLVFVVVCGGGALLIISLTRAFGAQ